MLVAAPDGAQQDFEHVLRLGAVRQVPHEGRTPYLQHETASGHCIVDPGLHTLSKVSLPCSCLEIKAHSWNMGRDGATLPAVCQLVHGPLAAIAWAPSTHRVHQLQHRQAGLEGWALWSIQPSEHPGKQHEDSLQATSPQQKLLVMNRVLCSLPLSRHLDSCWHQWPSSRADAAEARMGACKRS